MILRKTTLPTGAGKTTILAATIALVAASCTPFGGGSGADPVDDSDPTVTIGKEKPAPETTTPAEDDAPGTTDDAAPGTDDVPEKEKPEKPKPPVDASSPVPVPECGAYWGTYVNSGLRGGGNDATARLKAINSVEADLGRTFDMDHQFYRWDNFLTDHNKNEYVEKTISEGRIPFLSWKPIMEDGTNMSWNSISSGQHDSHIREKAGQVKSLSSPVMLVVGHEANARVGDFKATKGHHGHVTADAGSEADFVAAYKHIHDIFAEEGVSNVSWAWVMTRSPFEGDGSFADRMYPGDSYVDWVGLDPYNFFHGKDPNNEEKGNWREMSDQMQGFTNWVDSRGIDKPWVLGEWGTVEDPNKPGRKAQWLKNAGDYFESEDRLKAVVHFDSKPKNNWLYDTSESSKSSFKELGQRDHFKQRC